MPEENVTKADAIGDQIAGFTAEATRVSNMIGRLPATTDFQASLAGFASWAAEEPASFLSELENVESLENMLTSMLATLTSYKAGIQAALDSVNSVLESITPEE